MAERGGEQARGDAAVTDQPYFDGSTYDSERDGDRLGAQMAAVKALMSDRRWRTLSMIASRTGYPEASISARLRDLRKEKHGKYDVRRRYVENGIWEYVVLA